MTNVKEAFKKMDYEEALESNRESLEWITEHKGQFGHFIGGKFTKPRNLFKTINPFNKKEIAKVSQGTLADIKNSVEAARSGLKKMAISQSLSKIKIFICYRKIYSKGISNHLCFGVHGKWEINS